MKKNEYINNVKKSCIIASKTLVMIKKFIIPGISTNEINNICHNYIIKNNAKPACLNYLGFPKSICTSINEIVCHGIPSKNIILKNGDIINIDISIVKNNFFGDTSKMFLVGDKISNISKKLCLVAKKCLYLAIKNLKPYITLRIVGKTIENFAKKNNFSVVEEYCGHGIGNNLHTYPQVLNYDDLSQDKIILKPGMIFTIEPMINLGGKDTIVLKDGWTVKTKDNSLSAQFEHTILITELGYEVLTIRENENIDI